MNYKKSKISRVLVGSLILFGMICWGVTAVQAQPDRWEKEWPHTDFSKTAVDLSEII